VSARAVEDFRTGKYLLQFLDSDWVFQMDIGSRHYCNKFSDWGDFWDEITNDYRKLQYVFAIKIVGIPKIQHILRDELTQRYTLQ
jgi:hypothetical protein